MTDLSVAMVRETAHPGVEAMARSVAIVSGLIREPDQWPDAVSPEHQHGCRELALLYMRDLAAALPVLADGLAYQVHFDWLTPDREELYPHDDDGDHAGS